MQVLINGKEDAGKIDGGKLQVKDPGMKLGQTVLVEKRLTGYNAAWQLVRAAPIVSLSSLTRITTAALETSWSSEEPVGGSAGVRVYPVPDWVFFRLSIAPSAQGAVSSLQNRILKMGSNICVGSYLFLSPNYIFRLGAEGGMGLIISEQAATGSSLNVYANVLSVWGELNLSGVTFFIRPEVDLALSAQKPDMYGSSLVFVGGWFVPVALGAVVKF
jgi:hypothetical protein